MSASEKVSQVLGEFGLDKHRGGEVVAVKIEVNGTGYGLSESVAVDPVVIPPDEKAFVVFEVESRKDRYDKVFEGKGEDREWTGEWTYVQILDAGTAVILLGDSASSIRQAVLDQADRNRIHREESTGQYQLDRALQEAHQAGEHAESRVSGCLGCETETAFEKLESAGMTTDRPQGMTDEQWEASARDAASSLPSPIQDEVEKARKKRTPKAAASEGEPDPAE